MIEQFEEFTLELRMGILSQGIVRFNGKPIYSYTTDDVSGPKEMRELTVSKFRDHLYKKFNAETLDSWLEF